MTYDHLIDAAKARTTGQLDLWTAGYVTEGGTYVLASTPEANDDDRPHDLVAILAMSLDDSRVLVLRPTVNPDLVAALRAALDTDIHRLTLDFEDKDTLAQALEHIGDKDAPVLLTSGTVASGGQTYGLWEDFGSAIGDLDEREG